jgi:cytochrome bd-type quinol oxidase subunit 2
VPVVTEKDAVLEAPGRRLSGVGRVLVAVYAILALAALGRSIFQIIDRFEQAPVAFLLSLLAGVVYVVVTIALAARLRTLAWITISFELIGVLVVGTITMLAPDLLGHHANAPFGTTATVWSTYGAGYLFIPLVLPILGLVWLARSRRAGR